MHEEGEAILAHKAALLRLICYLVILSLYFKHRFGFRSGQNSSRAIFGFNIHKRLLSVFEGQRNISYDLNFGVVWLTSLRFRDFNAIFYSRFSFLLSEFLFLPIEDKG